MTIIPHVEREISPLLAAEGYGEDSVCADSVEE